MMDEMLNSHYYLQLYIYTLALHVHLTRYMPDYDFDRHIGGSIYIFMRGVEKTGENGIFFHQPKREIIEKMAETAVRQ
jgi:exodeoxyribonuclease V beta subunit